MVYVFLDDDGKVVHTLVWGGEPLDEARLDRLMETWGAARVEEPSHDNADEWQDLTQKYDHLSDGPDWSGSTAQYRCARCGSERVTQLAWVDMNTNAMTSDEPPDRDPWCDDCGMECSVITRPEVG